MLSDVCPVPPKSSPALIAPPRTTSRKQSGYCEPAKSKSNSPVGRGHGGPCADDVAASPKVATAAMVAAMADRPMVLSMGASMYDVGHCEQRSEPARRRRPPDG